MGRTFTYKPNAAQGGEARHAIEPPSKNPHRAGRRREHRCGRRVPACGRSRRDPDRNGLWPGGRCDLGYGGRGHLRRQGTAGLQSVDRPCRGSGERRARSGLRRQCEKTGAGVLAGSADDRGARLPDMPGQSPRARRPRQPRAARARASGRARADRGGRRSARRAFGQPLGARQPDAGRARRRRSRRANRLDPRRRPDSPGAGVDNSCLPRRTAASLAPRRDRERE